MNPLNIMTTPWAITPEKYIEIARVYSSQLNKEALNVKLNPLNNSQPPYEIINNTAIISIEGIISKKMSWMSYFFGGTSTLETAIKIKDAINNPDVKQVILLIDSPGGSVDGTTELSELIYSLRGDKKIIAYTDGSMLSAAYWIASAADTRIISSDTTMAGSIGVIATHMDFSQAYKDAGITVTEIVSGKFKNTGSPYNPLSPEQKDVLQGEVDYLHTVFVTAVARNLNVPVKQVLSVMTTDTNPPVFIGNQAITAGLIDSMSTFDDLIGSFKDGKKTLKLEGLNKFNPNSKTQTQKEDIIMDAKELKEKYPDTFSAIFNEGKTAGIVEGSKSAKSEIEKIIATAKAEGQVAGATAELQRIKEVQAQTLPGHEALIQECIDDGKTTGSEAAVKVLAAQKSLMSDAIKKFDADGKEINVPAAQSQDTVTSKDFMGLVADYKAEKNCTHGQAIKAVAALNPEAHEAYVAGLKNKKS